MADKLSKLETIKAESTQLRGDVHVQLTNDATNFDENAKQLLKFHGLYQQDDRDHRAANRAAGRDKSYSFMLRTRLPGGKLTAAQYLVIDDLATTLANNTLRITTRQCFQLHGVLKGDIKATIQAMNETLVTTLGACGDLVRNVMCCPVPGNDPVRVQIDAVTNALSDHLLPRTRAYHELWLDEEKVFDGRRVPGVAEEPIYGNTYLPRKFKIAVAYPGDNCVDVFTQDVGLIAVADGDQLLGFNVVVGGGMGMHHTKPDTFPRLADPLGFITPEHAVDVVEKIVLVQRDYGNRSDRKHARMKYLIHDWGIDRFRVAVETRLGYQLSPFRELPALENELHLGWHPSGDGHWHLGVSVENGRVQDRGEVQLKRGLRAVIERFAPEVRLTPNHDILLTGFHEDDRAAVDALLAAHGVAGAETLSNVQLFSMACPAMPTCGLALAESERALPAIIDAIEADAAALGLADERITIRMTGCPNGCARPYVADLAFVGRSADQYMIFVGGRNDGTRLNVPYQDLVRGDELAAAVRGLLAAFARERRDNERFGDFCARHAVDELRQLAAPQRDAAVHVIESDTNDNGKTNHVPLNTAA